MKCQQSGWNCDLTFLVWLPSKHETLNKCWVNVGPMCIYTLSWEMIHWGITYHCLFYASRRPTVLGNKVFEGYFVYSELEKVSHPIKQLGHIVPLDMKGCICHFAKWQIDPFISKGTIQDKTRQDNTRQDKTRQDKTRQDKTRQDKTRQDKTRQDKTRQDKTRQDKTRQDKTRQDKNLNGLFNPWSGEICLYTP